MKRWFKISKEVKVGISGKLKVNDAMPQFNDPAFEFRHKLGSVNGSSIILTPRSVALAHVQRIGRAGNAWASGLLNFSFSKERLTPKQLSACVRFHPSGSELLEQTVATMAFDTPEIEGDNILRNGFLTVSAIAKVQKHLFAGVQVTHATGTGNTGSGRTTEWAFHPIAQLGLLYKQNRSKVNLMSCIDCKYPKDRSEVKLRVEHTLEQLNLNVVGAVSWPIQSTKPTWSVGVYALLDDLIPL